jgi:hypothetical protein
MDQHGSLLKNFLWIAIAVVLFLLLTRAKN